MKNISIKTNNGFIEIITKKVCFIEVKDLENNEDFKTVIFHFDNGNIVTASKIAKDDINDMLESFC